MFLIIKIITNCNIFGSDTDFNKIKIFTTFITNITFLTQLKDISLFS